MDESDGKTGKPEHSIHHADQGSPLRKPQKANDEVFGALLDKAREAGLILYRSEAEPNNVLFVSERRSHDDMHKFGDDYGDQFIELAGVKLEDWEDVAWRLSDTRSL